MKNYEILIRLFYFKFIEHLDTETKNRSKSKVNFWKLGYIFPPHIIGGNILSFQEEIKARSFLRTKLISMIQIEV